jgi:hypothetical protein
MDLKLRYYCRLTVCAVAQTMAPALSYGARREFVMGIIMDLHRFRSGLLRAILAIKETGYGSDTQQRVQA